MSGVKNDMFGVKNYRFGVTNKMSGIKNDKFGVKNDMSGVENIFFLYKNDIFGSVRGCTVLLEGGRVPPPLTPPIPPLSGYPGGGIWEGERFLSRKIIEEINPGNHIQERFWKSYTGNQCWK